MPYYISRPKKIEAVQWRGNNAKEMEDFLQLTEGKLVEADDATAIFINDRYLFIEEGIWVIKESDGLSLMIDSFFRVDFQPMGDSFTFES